MVITVLIFIVTLLILVVIHELGHFLVAKKSDIKVLEFGFGIPPRAWGKKIGETLVSINWLPFGGFVRLLGEDEVDKETLDNKRSFAAKPVGIRIAVVIAGVIMNLLLAWVLFYIVLGAKGFKVEYPLLSDHQFIGVNQTNESSILIQQVQENTPASGAGLKAGDKIISFNGQTFDKVEDFSSKIKESAGQEAKLVVETSEGQITEISITPRKDPPPGEGAIGVALGQIMIAKLNYETPAQKILAGPIHSVNLVAYSGEIIGKLVGQSVEKKDLAPVSQTVSGPVGITSVVNFILTENRNPLIPYLDFVAVLSLNLAVMNVLPFPALDGGRLLFLLIEAITRKKVKPEIEKMAHSIGFAILITLIIFVTFSDVKKIIGL